MGGVEARIGRVGIVVCGLVVMGEWCNEDKDVQEGCSVNAL